MDDTRLTWLELLNDEDLIGLGLRTDHPNKYCGMLGPEVFNTCNDVVQQQTACVEINLRSSENLLSGPWIEPTCVIVPDLSATRTRCSGTELRNYYFRCTAPSAAGELMFTIKRSKVV